MTVTVVIPAYNSGRYIGKAIDSVLAQTRKPDEIIVVDDGSTDNTAGVAARYESQIRYIHQQNAGASVARNTGIQSARSEWVAFLDADDEWLTENLELQMGLLERNKELAWTSANFIRCDCGTDNHIDDLPEDMCHAVAAEMKGKEYFDSYFTAYLLHASGWTGTMVIRRDVLIEAGLFLPGQLRVNDMDMWFRIAFRNPRIGYTTKPLAIYHMNIPESIVRMHTHEDFICDFVDRQLKLSSRFGKLEEFKPCAANMLKHCIRGMLKNKTNGRLIDHCGKRARQMIKRYADLLPAGFKLNMRLRSIWPKATLAIIYTGGKIKELLGLKERK